VFLFAGTLAIPALVALASLREVPSAPLRPPATASLRAPARPSGRSWQFLTDRRLIAFAVCAVLFHLANAAMLPIAAAAVTKRAESEAGLIIAACIVGPQLITALLSPWAGRAAEAWGRRPILLLGFSALPIRGILLAGIGDPYLIIAIQLIDGLGAAVFGVLFPLIVADITRDTGNYTTSLGLVGLAIGGGATLSTVLVGARRRPFRRLRCLPEPGRGRADRDSSRMDPDAGNEGHSRCVISVSFRGPGHPPNHQRRRRASRLLQFRLDGVWLAASDDWSYAPGGRCVLLSARLLSAVGNRRRSE